MNIKKLFFGVSIVWCLLSEAQAGYYYQAQRAIQEAGKRYEATGLCMDHPKSFEIMAQFFKQTEEKGSSPRESTTCQILQKEKKVVCELVFMGSPFSTNTTYWFDTKAACDQSRSRMINGDKKKNRPSQ